MWHWSECRIVLTVLNNGPQMVVGNEKKEFHDAYRKYMKDFNIAIQFCIAHLIRDIKFLISLPDAETKA